MTYPSLIYKNGTANSYISNLRKVLAFFTNCSAVSFKTLFLAILFMFSIHYTEFAGEMHRKRLMNLPAASNRVSEDKTSDLTKPYFTLQ